MKKTLRRGVAMVAVLGAMNPAVASAEATHKKHNKFESRAKLEQVTESRIWRNKSIAFLHGDVTIIETLKDPIDPTINHNIELHMKNPIVVYRGDANTQTGFTFIEGKEYAIGYLNQKAKKPEVHLVNYNSDNMSFTPETDGNPNQSKVEYAFFGRDSLGGINFGDVSVSYDGLPHGGPLEDPAGNPEPVGLSYVPMK